MHTPTQSAGNIPALAPNDGVTEENILVGGFGDESNIFSAPAPPDKTTEVEASDVPVPASAN